MYGYRSFVFSWFLLCTHDCSVPCVARRLYSTAVGTQAIVTILANRNTGLITSRPVPKYLKRKGAVKRNNQVSLHISQVSPPLVPIQRWAHLPCEAGTAGCTYYYVIIVRYTLCSNVTHNVSFSLESSSDGPLKPSSTSIHAHLLIRWRTLRLPTVSADAGTASTVHACPTEC